MAFAARASALLTRPEGDADGWVDADVDGALLGADAAVEAVEVLAQAEALHTSAAQTRAARTAP